MVELMSLLTCVGILFRVVLAQTAVTSPATSSQSSSTTASAVLSPSQSCANDCSFVSVSFISSTWSQWISPVVVGTAIVVVDQANNLTTTSTKYNNATAQFMTNGTLRTLGGKTTARTAIVSLFTGGVTTLTYPTPYYNAESIKLAGTLHYTSAGTVSCTSWPASDFLTVSALPSHTPWPTPTPQATDTLDPYGETYTFVSDEQDIVSLDYQGIVDAFPSSPWMPSIYQSCRLFKDTAPLTVVTSVGALISTTTQTISGTPLAQSLGQSTTTTPIPAAPLSTSAAPVTSSTTACTDAACFILAGISGSATATSGLTLSSTSSIAAVFSIGNTVLQQGSASQVVVGTQTLIPGGSAVVQSGTTLSLASGGSAIVVNGQSTVPVATTVIGPTSAATIFNVGGTTITQGPSSQVVVGSQTLLPGSAITVSGTTLSLASSGGAIVVNGASTISAAVVATSATPLTLTANLQGQTVIGSQTVTLTGSSATINGTTYSIGGSGTVRTLVPVGTSSSSTGRPYTGAGVVLISSNKLLIVAIAICLLGHNA